MILSHQSPSPTATLSPRSGGGRQSTTYSSSVMRMLLRHSTLLLTFLIGIFVGSLLNSNTTINVGEQEKERQLVQFSEYDKHSQKHSSVLRDNHNNNNDKNNDYVWQTVHVYRGGKDQEGEESSNAIQYYSQAKQDEVVLQLLKNKTNGYYIDLASNDARLLSNTYTLEKYFNWNGLCIEPNPIYWHNLTKYRPRCQIIGAVVGYGEEKQVYFRYDANEHGGIIGYDNPQKYKSTSTIVSTISLPEILTKFQVPSIIDYLSLDVEGAEELIMNQFPFSNYKIKILTIERPNQTLRTLLENNGYKDVLRLSRWGETLWIHTSYQSEMDLTNLQEYSGKNQYRDAQLRKKKERMDQQENQQATEAVG
jgi:FkbM family methyltransferase